MEAARVRALSNTALMSAGWEELTARAPASIAGSRAWVEEAFAKVHPDATPLLLTVEVHRRLVGVLTLAVHDSTGDRTLRMAGAPHNDLTDLLVRPGFDRQAADAVLDALAAATERGARVMLEDVDPDGVLAAADRDRGALKWTLSDPAPAIHLRGGWRTAASARRRAQWDRKLRTLRARHAVSLRRREREDVAPALPDFLRLREARRRAAGRPPERKPTAFLVGVVERLAGEGRMMLMELLVDGRPVASDLYQVDGGVAMMWVRGLDPDWRAFPCGHLLLRATADRLAADGYDVLDLGRGAEPYKLVFGAEPRVLLEARGGA
jgi:CelD/BcsL family acetyltransferase involved in cellulose biosynthesis